MADTLTCEEAARLLAILNAVDTRPDATLSGAREKLERTAGDAPLPPPPLVGLVVLNEGGVPELVGGNVALVDFSELNDRGSTPTASELDELAASTERELNDRGSTPTASELDELAASTERDLNDGGALTVKDLRNVAHIRRIERFERDGTVEGCTVTQLSQLLAHTNVTPDEVTVKAACRTDRAA